MVAKFDGVVDSVRYKGGQIQVVRAYERRGTTFSDHVLIPRKELIERLKKGKKFMTGRRRELLASTFDVEKPIRLVQHNGYELISTRPEVIQDDLEGVPIF